ncbi:MAG: alpha/beta-hydrolase family protein [Desulfobacterales bacterium]
MKARLSVFGLLLGTVFFSFSLTPSLLPRPFPLQGVLSGLSFAAGYGLGVACLALWRYLQLALPATRAARMLKNLAFVMCILMVVGSLWQAANWQDSIRGLMGIEDSSGIRPILLLVISALAFFLLLGLGRLFRKVFLALSLKMERHVPPRISRLLAVTASLLFFWMVIDGVLFSFLLKTADRSFQQLDALIDDDMPRPLHADQAGSSASLINWKDLGRQGRNFVATGPTAEDLSSFFKTSLPAPLRVYVGLNSADSAVKRTRLALKELIRVGGFERAVLMLVTPTGTGWVDPAALDTVEYLHRGDIATVVAQYSYLSSPLALMTEAAYGAEMARALFEEIYGHWRSLPADSRPRLYLHGLSLGSLNSDISFDFYDIIDEPFHGALWSGPPFRHDTWRRVTAQRDPGSAPWLPQFRNGSVVRFMNQTKGLERGTSKWGEFRIAFLQYASDPITFFSPQTAWRAPDWMREPRGPDVSPGLRWFPIVTMLQLAADMMVGTAPKGFGHEYAATHYIDAWLALTEPAGWSGSELTRLRTLFENR